MPTDEMVRNGGVVNVEVTQETAGGFLKHGCVEAEKSGSGESTVKDSAEVGSVPKSNWYVWDVSYETWMVACVDGLIGTIMGPQMELVSKGYVF